MSGSNLSPIKIQNYKMIILREDTIKFTKKRFSLFLFQDDDGRFLVVVGDDNIIYEFEVSPKKRNHERISNKLYTVIQNSAARMNQKEFVNMMAAISGLPAETACLYTVTSKWLNRDDIARWTFLLELKHSVSFDEYERLTKITIRNLGQIIGYFDSVDENVYRFIQEIGPKPDLSPQLEMF